MIAPRNDQPSEELAAAMHGDVREPPTDKLDKLRDAVRRERDAEFSVHDAEDTLKERKRVHFDLAHRELPDLFELAGVDVVAIRAEGNYPGFEGTLKPYYSANISADWNDERREAGFDALRALGGGDLVRTIITVEFGKGDEEKADALVAILSEQGWPYHSRKGVPWKSLTAFVQEQVEANNPQIMGALDALGGSVGKIVKLKERK